MTDFCINLQSIAMNQFIRIVLSIQCKQLSKKQSSCLLILQFLKSPMQKTNHSGCLPFGYLFSCSLINTFAEDDPMGFLYRLGVQITILQKSTSSFSATGICDMMIDYCRRRPNGSPQLGCTPQPVHQAPGGIIYYK